MVLMMSSLLEMWSQSSLRPQVPNHATLASDHSKKIWMEVSFASLQSVQWLSSDSSFWARLSFVGSDSEPTFHKSIFNLPWIFSHHNFCQSMPLLLPSKCAWLKGKPTVWLTPLQNVALVIFFYIVILRLFMVLFRMPGRETLVLSGWMKVCVYKINK